jgi:hypothetical protein
MVGDYKEVIKMDIKARVEFNRNLNYLEASVDFLQQYVKDLRKMALEEPGKINWKLVADIANVNVLMEDLKDQLF